MLPNENIPTETTVTTSVTKEESIWDLVRFALITLIIAIGLRVFIAQPFVVSGASMVPTFHDKEYLIVDQLSYRFSEPTRGDVVVFHPPGQPKGIYYIKRVIGLPNETVTITAGLVHISNDTSPEGFDIAEPYISTEGNNVINKKLGPDEYFVMGDNRPYSSDSRVWGTLPRDNILGRAFLRLYPFNKISFLPGVYHSYTAD